MRIFEADTIKQTKLKEKAESNSTEEQDNITKPMSVAEILSK